MVKQREFSLNNLFHAFLYAALIFVTVSISSCSDDPDPVNEEEVITTLKVVLSPVGGGTAVTLQFKDADGSGSAAPVKTISGPLAANEVYTGEITLLNESGATPVDITPEVEEEGNDHLFCFTPGSNLVVAASDTDDNGMPLGLTSLWMTSGAASSNIKIVLRHQPGTKTGTCPGTGETDVEIDFNLTIQ